MPPLAVYVTLDMFDQGQGRWGRQSQEARMKTQESIQTCNSSRCGLMLTLCPDCEINMILCHQPGYKIRHLCKLQLILLPNQVCGLDLGQTTGLSVEVCMSSLWVFFRCSLGFCSQSENMHVQANLRLEQNLNIITELRPIKRRLEIEVTPGCECTDPCGTVLGTKRGRMMYIVCFFCECKYL